MRIDPKPIDATRISPTIDSALGSVRCYDQPPRAPGRQGAEQGLEERSAAICARVLERCLAEEIAAGPARPVWREDPDEGAISLVITQAGLRALGIEAPEDDRDANPPEPPGPDASDKAQGGSAG